MNSEHGACSVTLLESGYWHVRFGAQRFFQFHRGAEPTLADGFGWVTDADLATVRRAIGRVQETEK